MRILCSNILLKVNITASPIQEVPTQFDLPTTDDDQRNDANSSLTMTKIENAFRPLIDAVENATSRLSELFGSSTSSSHNSSAEQPRSAEPEDIDDDF